MSRMHKSQNSIEKPIERCENLYHTNSTNEFKPQAERNKQIHISNHNHQQINRVFLLTKRKKRTI